MLFESFVGNLAVAICLLNSNEAACRDGTCLTYCCFCVSAQKSSVCFAAGICQRPLGPFNSVGGLRWIAGAVGEAI